MAKDRGSPKWICLGVVLAVVAYTATFSYWWCTSPVEKGIAGGREVQYLQFHFNAFSWHTAIIWTPAFWCMKHVFGYELISFAAMGKDSIVEYAK